MRVRTPMTTSATRPMAAPHAQHHGMRPATIAGAAVAGALIALAFGATSAAAQTVYADGTYVDEFVVTAPVYRYRDGPNRMSARVSLRDLDLTTYSGQQMMKMRIRDTAYDLCRRLGERGRAGDALAPSCVDKAIRDARPQMRAATRYAYLNRDRAYAYLDYPSAYRIYP